ncbi:hypothetical protein D8Y20_13445 [Mariprofundus sp. EBB-1]|uniref:formylglycine-generating enzyme family protein n=1 Tax=Mariprofundus sp. EBB-1 TaxID=2650971 RepID=UPI000EF19F40|nr:hypothetical protein D8Y20_13445 [Mariprofundus sp. EBB-1]
MPNMEKRKACAMRSFHQSFSSRGNRPEGKRVLRGGSWNNNPNNMRSANRNRNSTDNRNNNIGFRLVQSAHEIPEFSCLWM